MSAAIRAKGIAIPGSKDSSDVSFVSTMIEMWEEDGPGEGSQCF
jgi:hypothetical protein